MRESAAVRPPVPQRGRSTVLALVVPVLLALGAAALAFSWASELPDPVATHWDTQGVDGTGRLSVLVALVTTLSILCSTAGWALAFFAGRDAITRRLAIGFSLGLATFLAGTLIGTLAIQRGLTSAWDAPSAGPALTLAMTGGLLLGILGALAVRPDPRMPAARADLRAAGAPLGTGGGPAEWIRQVTSGRLSVLGALVGLVLAVAGLLTGTALILVPLGGVLGLLLATMSRFTVRVSSTGLAVHGAFGWPSLHVPADEILDVQVTTVSPLRDFGGWGYRVGRGGAIGIVVRTGEAIEVERTGGRRAVVTVDDAETGAALLRAAALGAPRE